jgi:hypothetical protein
MGVGERGLAIENIANSVYGQMGGNVQRCPPNYNFIDHYYGGTTTQVGSVTVVEGATVVSDKSLDLRGASVQTAQQTESFINSNHVNALVKMPDTFQKMNLRIVNPQSRIVNLWYGPGEPTPAQALGMKGAADHAALNDIHINYIAIP